MEKAGYIMLFFVALGIFAISLVSAADSTCTADLDCKVRFSSCSCSNVCILANQESSIDCEKYCPKGSSNFSITECKCENNQCVGKQTGFAPGCKILYWFDIDTKECGQKQFCGAYMYYGLRTFESKTQCEKALNESCSCQTDAKVCPDGSTVGRTCPKCEFAPCNPEKNEYCDYEKNGKCYKNLSNGRNAEIKIMPATASEKAIERLSELNFTIQLKEVGKGEDVRPVYELTGNKEGRFLGIFKIIAKIQAQVDAETGEIKVIKPWWSFLASRI